MANRHKAFKKGGGVGKSSHTAEKAAYDAGNMDVIKEAREEKCGGKVKKKATGGMVEAKACGGKAMKRFDKKSRGGSNNNPFSSAKVGK